MRRHRGTGCAGSRIGQHSRKQRPDLGCCEIAGAVSRAAPPDSRVRAKVSATSPRPCALSAAAATSCASRSTATRAPPSPTPSAKSLQIRFAAATAPRQIARLSRQIGQRRAGGLGIASKGAQHVEAHDVARALPDRIDRRLAIKPRQREVLDVAVAAEALHRLVDQRRGGLAHPVFYRRREQPGPRRLRRHAGAPDRTNGKAASPPRARPRPRPPCRPAPFASSAGSDRRFWKTLRCRQWCSACARPARIMPAEEIAQSSRVSCTIGRMVRMPCPPRRHGRHRRCRTPPPTTRWSGCRACPSIAGNAAR